MAHICSAKRYNDEMVCHRCKLTWDVKDPEPPTCLTVEPPSREVEIHNKGVADVLRILES